MLSHFNSLAKSKVKEHGECFTEKEPLETRRLKAQRSCDYSAHCIYTKKRSLAVTIKSYTFINLEKNQ